MYIAIIYNVIVLLIIRILCFYIYSIPNRSQNTSYFVTLLYKLFNQQINFLTINFHQIFCWIIYVATYGICTLSVFGYNIFGNSTNYIIKFLVEFVITSLMIRIVYEVILFRDNISTPTTSWYSVICSCCYCFNIDFGLLYKITTLITCLILFMFGTSYQCLNEMGNLTLITIGSIFDLNIIFDTMYVRLGNTTESGNYYTKYLCELLKPQILKLYFTSTLFDILLVIYYKYFTEQFHLFFFYKLAMFCNICVKMYRLGNSFDPTVQDFESSSVKYMKNWINNNPT